MANKVLFAAAADEMRQFIDVLCVRTQKEMFSKQVVGWPDQPVIRVRGWAAERPRPGGTWRPDVS